MEGRGDAEPAGAEARGLEGLLGGLDGGRRAAEDDLIRGVVVGRHDVGHAGVGEGRHHGVLVALHRRHGARRRRGLGRHDRAAAAGGPHEGLLIEDTGGVQGGDLSEGVAADHVGREAQGAHQAEVAEAAHADGGLGDVGGRQGRLLGLAARLIEGGGREDRPVQGLVLDLGVEVGGPIPGGAGGVEVAGHPRAHVQDLAALAGEEESHLALDRAEAVGGAAGQGEGLTGLAGDPLRGLAELVGQLGARGRHHREAGGGGRIEAGLGGPGDVLEGAVGAGLAGPIAGLGGHVGAVHAAEDHQLGGQAVQAARLGGLAQVLLDDHVEVGAAEAEARDAGPPAVVAAAHPGARLEVQVEGAVVQVHLGVGRVHLDGRRQGLVVDGHQRLEQAGGPGRALGVADLALHRAQGAPLGVGLDALGVAVDQRQALELRGVARHGAVPWASTSSTVSGEISARS